MKPNSNTGRDPTTTIHIGRAEALEKRVALMEAQFDQIADVILDLREALAKKKSNGKKPNGNCFPYVSPEKHRLKSVWPKLLLLSNQADFNRWPEDYELVLVTPDIQESHLTY